MFKWTLLQVRIGKHQQLKPTQQHPDTGFKSN